MKAIIIRMWHNNQDHFEWRYHYFASCVLPRLQAQTVSDFDICILSDPKDHQRLKALDKRIKPFTMITDGYDYRTQSNFTQDMTKGLDKYNLQIRLDSDDLVEPDFVQKCAEGKKVVTFQPELFILKKLQVKKMKARYRDDRPSMFMSFRSDMDDYKCIYSEVFFRFGRYDCTLHPEGTCYMTIHGTNKGTSENS